MVDILLLDLNQTVAESQQQSHTGIYNLVTMDLTITVLCESKFVGSNCTQCMPGFTGDETDHCLIAVAMDSVVTVIVTIHCSPAHVILGMRGDCVKILTV